MTFIAIDLKTAPRPSLRYMNFILNKPGSKPEVSKNLAQGSLFVSCVHPRVGWGSTSLLPRRS